MGIVNSVVTHVTGNGRQFDERNDKLCNEPCDGQPVRIHLS